MAGRPGGDVEAMLPLTASYPCRDLAGRKPSALRSSSAGVGLVGTPHLSNGAAVCTQGQRELPQPAVSTHLGSYFHLFSRKGFLAVSCSWFGDDCARGIHVMLDEMP